MARISSTPIDKPSGMMRRTSAWVPAIVVVQARHCPQPGSPSAVHCRAAAKHSAATDRPDPGGPVINQACVIDPTGLPGPAE
jgi:adenylate cyclase